MIKNNNPNKNIKAIILLILLSTIILLPSFLLLIASSWSNDDYLLAKLFQLLGLEGLSSRVFVASPRFLSETILYLYYHLVAFVKKPFTGVFLLILWLCLILSLFISFKTIIDKFSRVLADNNTVKKSGLEAKTSQPNKSTKLKLLISLLLSLILFCYFIYAERPVTMYYAPAVAAPYLLTLSGIILSINFLLTKADNKYISWVEFFSFTIISLMVASSWEIGAVYQLVLNICLLLILLLNSFKSLFKYLPFSRINWLSKIKIFIAIFFSSALSLYVIFLINTYRIASVELNSSLESTSMGNWKNSFIASINRIGQEILFINNSGTISNAWQSFSYSIICKLGILLIIILLLLRINFKINQQAIIACVICLIPLLATDFVTILTSYYQFGEICCARQLSFRGALIGLVILILGFLCSSQINQILNNNIDAIKQPQDNKINVLISQILGFDFTLIIVFTLTLSLLVNLQFKDLRKDIINLNKIIQTNKSNWQESSDQNNFYAINRQIPTHYIYKFNLPEGIYPSCSSPQNILAILYMDYFEKAEFYVLPVDKDISYLTNDSTQNDRFLTSRNNPDNIRFICRYSKGWVDKINNSTQTSSVVTVSKNKPVELQGWAIKPDKTKVDEVIITMGNENQIVATTPVNQPNQWVAKSFGNPDLINSNWTIIVNPPFNYQPEETVTFKAWAYDAHKKSAYLFREFYLQFVE